MNTMSNLSVQWNMVLQISGFQMKLILYLSLCMVALTGFILIYVYRAMKVVLRASGLEVVTEDVLTVDWVKYLYVSTLTLGLVSIYIFSKFI